LTQSQAHVAKPHEFYDLLLDYAAGPDAVTSVCLGLVWTYCETEASLGLAMSPGSATRTLPWAGTLRGRPLTELAAWVREFDPFKAVIGMAAINAGINSRDRLPLGTRLEPEPGVNNNLAVFAHFLPQLTGKRIAVIGRYPGLEQFTETHDLNLTVLERQPAGSDLPEAACEFVLGDADWVFITASSIANKTFPRLAELARDAVSVLMGPTTPWLPEFYHFGIDYLAGVELVDEDSLRATVTEGGGVRLFDHSVRYRVAPIGIDASKSWARSLIAAAAQERETLKEAMEQWYASGNQRRFPEHGRLEATTQRLSRLDTCFKRMWDEKPDTDTVFLSSSARV